eukprot:CAMPEP_0113514680 /NCGR_PEP_ID=MMETSP0014_2-20120614/40538_1 /TAXON_ID=2857 /ORGANISM="Nitzschia sp." /LENGTH=249 /DNA_ID=CAMNT_0000411193 /DNA_START=11 /DNA_END=760 /DNA_ORIENTATION=- /assembly_acc=CAM_ASM_000159
MGCTPPPGFIQCLDCEGKPVSGGFGMVQEEVDGVGMLQEEVDGDDDNGGGSGQAVTRGAPAASRAQIPSNNTTQQQHQQHQQHQQQQRRRPDCTKSREEILDQFQRDKDGTSKLRLVPEIYLCQEHVSGPKHAENILKHELIHAIDMCRTNMDPLRNCMQLACTEVRAENLSGECNQKWEFLRGQLTSPRQLLWPTDSVGHQRKCVKRRAIDSVRGNPNCTDQAELYVDAVFQRCYADTFPFERHPNQR